MAKLTWLLCILGAVNMTKAVTKYYVIGIEADDEDSVGMLSEEVMVDATKQRKVVKDDLDGIKHKKIKKEVPDAGGGGGDDYMATDTIDYDVPGSTEADPPSKNSKSSKIEEGQDYSQNDYQAESKKKSKRSKKKKSVKTISPDIRHEQKDNDYNKNIDLVSPEDVSKEEDDDSEDSDEGNDYGTPGSKDEDEGEDYAKHEEDMTSLEACKAKDISEEFCKAMLS